MSKNKDSDMTRLEILRIIANENCRDSQEHDIEDMVPKTDARDNGTTSWDEFEASIYGDDYYGK